MSLDLDRPAPSCDVGRPPASRPTARAAMRPLLIRLHFLSGFLAAPIILSLSVTGILFAWNFQIDSLRFSGVFAAAESSAAPLPLADQVRAAVEARPDHTVTAITPANPEVFGGRETTAIAMKPAGAAPGAEFGHAAGALSVYADPATAEVTGEISETSRSAEWLRNVHSSWQIGSSFPLMELAASWLVVSILTGLYLYWPTLRRNLGSALVPRLRAPGYRRANALHTVLGVWLTIPLLVLIVTGLTWTTVAGSRVDDLKATFSGPTPTVATNLAGGAAAAEPVPVEVNEVAIDEVDVVARGAAEADVTGLLKLTPPTTEDTAWAVELRDQKFPMRPVNLAVDGSTGDVVDRVDWSERPLMSRLTSMGISFHQAELFGVLTQLYLTAITVGLMVLIVAAYRMWWLRRRPGTFGAPPRAGPLLCTVPVPVMIVAAVLIYAMPTLGVSLVAYLAIERIARAVRARRPLAEADRPEELNGERVGASRNA